MFKRIFYAILFLSICVFIGFTISETTKENTTINLVAEESGLFYIEAYVNDVPMKFILDSGCSTMTLTQTEIDFLIKHGYISESDFTQNTEAINADGETNEYKQIIIKNLKVNNKTLTSVPCIIVDNKMAEPLLGQLILSQFGKITIDYENSILTFY